MNGKTAKKSRRLVLTKIILEFEDGTTSELDTRKVNIVDRETGEPLFNVVIEPKE